MANFIFTLRIVVGKSAEKNTLKKYVFYISFLQLCLMSSKPTHYLLTYGNFKFFAYHHLYCAIHLIGHYNPLFSINKFLPPIMLCTYIHNWLLRVQPFSQDYWSCYAYHLWCVLILYMSGGTYSLKSTANDIFLYFFSEFLPEIWWEEIAEEIRFVFCLDLFVFI